MSAKRRRKPLKNEVLRHLKEKAEAHREREAYWFVQPDDDEDEDETREDDDWGGWAVG